jgi:outer membrane receptor protein involved in Fe transport
MLRIVFARRNSALFLVAAIWAIAFLFAGQSRAQVAGATLSGTITDPSGAAIATAEVSVTNKETGVNRAVVTDTAGFYSVPNLLPGTYDVTVAARGFSTAKESGIQLTVGAEQTLNIPMRLGEANQTVQVEAAAPLVQLGSSTISSEVDSKQILEMPLNGRSWQDLATLVPGVNAIETQVPFENGAIRGNRGFGNQLTISGGRPTQNNYRLDGNSITDYAMGGPGSVLGVNLGVDAIQEFAVVTGNYSAEYGRTSGGIVNAVSKSGTNLFHGDVYEFFRNQVLDANDFFSNTVGSGKLVYRRNQFGAAAGGPIVRDKTFIFGDYEGIRQAEGSPSSSSTVLSDAARAGNLCANPPSCTVINHVNVDPLIQKYLAIIPHANGPVNSQNPDKASFVFAPTQVIHENYETFRLDHRINAKDSLFATYNYDDTPLNTQDGLGNANILSQTSRHIAALEETHVFNPALVNSARLGFNRNNVINYQAVSAINPAIADPALSLMPGFGPPVMFISGFARTTGGLPPAFTHHTWNSIQFYDDAFLIRGNHSLKFGFALERMRYTPFSLYLPTGLVRFNGKKTGNPEADFLTNQPYSLEGGLPPGVSPRGFRQTLFGGYVQDDWKVRRNLTLNVGLRYEMTTIPNEVEGKTTTLRNISDPLPVCGTTAPTATNVVYGKPGCAGVGGFFASNPTTRNFEPRFGFAWDPKRDGKMAVRGGFALFDVLPLPGFFFTQSWMPFFLTGTVQNTPATPWKMGVPGNNPGSAFSYFGSANDPTCTSPLGNCKLTASYVEPNPKRNYVEQWNINVQRQITSTLTASVGYVGSHGLHLLIRGDDFDMVIPTHTSAGWLWPANDTPKQRINPNFGIIRGMMWNTSSRYDAVQFNVQKRFSHGFQFGGNYTYSKSMDNDSATIAGDAFSNSVTTWFWFAPSISWAPSDFNFTHTAVLNAIWQIPVSSSLKGPAAGVLRGWEVGGIFKANSGVPTTPLISGDPIGAQNSGSDTFGIPDKIPGCDPINHNFKKSPNLIYINTSCFTLPKATPEIAANCVPFGFSPPGSAHPNSGIAGTCSNLLGNAGRNSIVGPNLFNVDFSVHKDFAVTKISEAFKVQFRTEFFNILNHANFTPPLPFFGASNAQIFNADGTQSGGGAVQQPLATRPRIIQFALKAIW